MDNMRSKRTGPAKNRIKKTTKNYQKPNDDNQTYNKSRNKDMNEEQKRDIKANSETIDQKEEKHSISLTSGTRLQPEVFDSYRYSAMSEMKEAADVGPDNASKVLSKLEEKQRLDPATISINSNVKTDPEGSLNTSTTTSFPTIANPMLEERDRSGTELKEDGLGRQEIVKLDIAQVSEESEKQNHLGDAIRSYDGENEKEYQSNLISNDNDPSIPLVKLWQDYVAVWINTYTEFVKAWTNTIKR